MTKFQILCDIIYNHNQHPERTGKESLALRTVMSVLGLSYSESLKLIATHCNSITFYAVLKACGYIAMSYAEFFRMGIKTGFLNKFGFFEWEKEDILKVLVAGVLIEEYSDIKEAVCEDVYQMRIENDNGSHFMGAYLLNGTWFLADPNNRGVGVTLESGLRSGDKIMWVKRFVC